MFDFLASIKDFDGAWPTLARGVHDRERIIQHPGTGGRVARGLPDGMEVVRNSTKPLQNSTI
ncbi:hypothetical protein ACFL45_05715 [Candidatus Neomarinimicrobiota bacterium]